MMFTKGDIKVDIIAAFSTEGEIIPLKIRFPDDNGEIKTYKIVGYRETTEIGSKGFQPVLNFDIKIIVHTMIWNVVNGRLYIVRIFRVVN